MLVDPALERDNERGWNGPGLISTDIRVADPDVILVGQCKTN